MRLKNYLVSVISLLLGGIITYTLLVYSNEPHDMEEEFKEFEKETFIQIKKLEIQNSGLHVKDTTAYIGTDSTNLFLLKDILDKPKLVLYFSRNTCTPCVEDIIKLINSVFNSEEIEKNTIYISPKYTFRYRNNCYNKPLLSLKGDTLGIPLEGIDIPFLFILDKELSIQNLCVYNKLAPYITLTYLKEIKKKFFN